MLKLWPAGALTLCYALAGLSLPALAADAQPPTPAATAAPAPTATASAPAAPSAASTPAATAATTPFPGMPPVVDPTNVYSETAAGHLSAATQGALSRVYVPDHSADAVTVIDPATLKVVDRYPVGLAPQHVVPSWDLKTLWVTNNNDFGRRGSSSLTPIDPITGKPGKSITVTDAYNMYFMPDGSAAIVVNEAQRRLDFRDPHSMKLINSIDTSACPGLNHADFSTDGAYAIFSCEFGGSIAKVDLVNRKMAGVLPLPLPPDCSEYKRLQSVAARSGSSDGSRGRRGGRRRRAASSEVVRAVMTRGMPQDVRLAADGKAFYVADMMADGVFLIDGEKFSVIDYIATGPGAHGFVVSRDGKHLYVANRGSHSLPPGAKHNDGGVSVIDFATRKIVANWPIPGGGSPDMGGLSADGKTLWFSGRFDDEVYAINTDTGSTTKIPVGHNAEPHGLAVWPQPGRFCLGHTGNMR